jgi:hypothetical protein
MNRNLALFLLCFLLAVFGFSRALVSINSVNQPAAEIRRGLDMEGHEVWLLRTGEYYVLGYEKILSEIHVVIFLPNEVVDFGQTMPQFGSDHDGTNSPIALVFATHQEALDAFGELSKANPGYHFSLYDEETAPPAMDPGNS